MTAITIPSPGHQPDRPTHARVSGELFWEHCKRCYELLPEGFDLARQLTVPLMGIPAIMNAHGLNEAGAVMHILAQYKEKSCRDMSPEKTAILYACCWAIMTGRPTWDQPSDA